MPIPTDTYWNIKKLNVVFAISALALMVTLGWSILQDYGKSWRGAQDAGRVWEAALTQEKIQQVLPPEQAKKYERLSGLVQQVTDALKDKDANLETLAQKVRDAERELGNQKVLSEEEAQSLAQIRTLLSDPAKQKEISQYRDLDKRQRDLVSYIQTREFTFANVKAEYTVALRQIEEARTAGNREAEAEARENVQKTTRKVLRPSTSVEEEDQLIWDRKKELKEVRDRRDAVAAPVDELKRINKKLGTQLELYKKKLEGLAPTRLDAKLSEHVRKAPLMGFINPPQKVKQVVLKDVRTDVSFMKIDTIDRCMSCHVNIDNKDYTEAKIIGYLEEQLATSRGLRLPQEQKANAPSVDKPGPAAMPEFWHAYARQLHKRAPGLIASQSGLIDALKGTVGPQAAEEGKPARPGVVVKYGKETLTEFAYDPSVNDGDAAEKQDAVLLALIDAWQRYANGAATGASPQRSGKPQATAEIPAGFNAEAAAAAQESVHAYGIALAGALKARLSPKEYKTLEDRYRAGLIERVNVYRKQKGFGELDPSPALLAHPRLDLYVAGDSKHPMDGDNVKLGCTSCHDGSGQETDFVLAAHTARSIWVDRETGLPILGQQIKKNGEAKGHDEDLVNMREVAFEHATSLHFDELAPGHKGTNGHPAHHGDAHGGDAAPKAGPKAGVMEYVDPISGASRRAVSQYDYWAKKYEWESGTTIASVNHMWDWPMRAPEYIEVNCARCHPQVHDIRDEAPVLYEGRMLFQKLGCANCHQMDSIAVDDQTEPTKLRKVGPDLRQVSAKLSAAFLDSWIWAPKAFRPSTMMPHFFMLENSSSDEEIRRTQQEVLAIRTYLTRTATTRPVEQSAVLKDPANKMPAIVEDGSDAQKEAVARGRAIFAGFEGPAGRPTGIADKMAGVGCVACHTNLNEVGQRWLTDDMIKSGVVTKDLKDKLGKDPTRRQQLDEANKRYEAMSYNERHLYALKHFPEPIGHTLGGSHASKYPDGSDKPIFQHHGPELSAVGTKLLAGRTREQAVTWLYQWLMHPQHYSAYSVMPRLRLTPAEAMDLAEYLMAQRRPEGDAWSAREIQADPTKTAELLAFFFRSQMSQEDANRTVRDDREMTRQVKLVAKNQLGKADDAEQSKFIEGWTLEEKQRFYLGNKLVTHYGCMNCHAINGMEKATSPCANLSDWGQKGIDKLDFGYLAHHWVEEFEAKPETAKASVLMVNGLSVDAVALIDHANAKKWSEPIAKPAAAAWPHIGHTRQEWLTHKLKNSRIYDRGKVNLEPEREVGPDGKPKLDDKGNPVLKEKRTAKPYDKLRMPTFYLDEGQVHAIVTFVLSNRDRLVTPTMLAAAQTDSARQTAHGRQIADKYNCVACHRTEGNDPPIQQYWNQGFFDKGEMTAKAPPSLRSEGSRVHHAWLFNFLKYVEREGTPEPATGRMRLRPQPYVRMPSFPVTDDEATALAAYFNAVAQKEAKDLAKLIEPVMVKARGDAKEMGVDLATNQDDIWPEDGWHSLKATGSPELLFADLLPKLKAWALEHTLLKESDFAADNSPEDLAKTWKSALFDARFMIKSLPGKYPFAEYTRPTLSPTDPRFKKGEKLFHFMQCQSCHVIGDEKDPRVLAGSKGPNLSQTHRRIQRTWARHWVQEPQTIQPGNPMAAIFFSGLAIPAITDPTQSIFSLKGLPHITGSPTKELAMMIQREFGGTVEEQADLVLDFVWAAGLTNYTSPNPPEGEPKLQVLPMPPATQPATKPATKPADEAVGMRWGARGIAAVLLHGLLLAEAPAAAPATQPTTQPGLPPEIAERIKPEDYGLPPIPGITAPLPEKTKVKKAAGTGGAAPAVVAAGPSGKIAGKVVLDGTPPKRPPLDMKGTPACASQHPGGVAPDDLVIVGPGGAFKNVIVSVQNVKGTHPVPSAPAVLDQKGCRYEPRVLPMMVGQPIIIKNSDPFMHNVNGKPLVNPAFGFSQNTIDPGKPVPPMKRPDEVQVTCQVHPWMSSRFVVFNHPFFAVTDAGGSFTISGLPPGTYTLTTWHELGEKVSAAEQKQVKVEADKTAEVSINLRISE